MGALARPETCRLVTVTQYSYNRHGGSESPFRLGGTCCGPGRALHRAAATANGQGEDEGPRAGGREGLWGKMDGEGEGRRRAAGYRILASGQAGSPAAPARQHPNDLRKRGNRTCKIR